MKLPEKITALCACFLLVSAPAVAVAEETAAGDTDIAQQMFTEAIERREAGDIYTAIRLFELITEARPDLNRARLELAVAYHQANQYQDAIRELRLVLEDKNTPDNVRLSILAYLGQVANDEKRPEGTHQLSYYLKAGLLNNSNLNANQAVATGLNATSTASLSSIGTDIAANVSHRYNRRDLLNIANTPTALAWQSQATISSNVYSEESDFNINTLSLSTGPTFISPGRWRGSVLMQADYIVLGSDHLATDVSFKPDVTFDLGHYRSLLVETSFTTHSYPDPLNAGYEGSTVMVGAGYTTFLPRRGTGIEAGVRATRENADFNAFSYGMTELYASGFISINEQMNAYLRLNNRDYQFDAMDPNVGVIRDESELGFALGFNYDHLGGPLKGWVMNIEFSSVDSDSNADSLDYRRNLVSLNWSRYFQ